MARRPTKIAHLGFLAAMCVSAHAQAQQAPPVPAEDAELKAPEREDERERARQRQLFELERRDVQDSEETGGQAGAGLRDDVSDLQGMTREELNESGFDFGGASRDQTSSTAWTALLTVGLVAHGAGHYVLGEERMAAALLTMEAVGILLFTSGLLLPRLTEGEWGGGSYSRAMVYTGAGLFSLSFALDIAGLLQGVTSVAPQNTDLRQGAWLLAQVGYLNTRRYPLQTALQVDLGLNTRAFDVSAFTLQDVSLSTSIYGGQLTWRIARDGESSTFVYAQLEADYFILQDGGGFDRLTTAGLLGGSVDLGLLNARLRSVALGAELGYGSQWYWIETPQIDALTQEAARELGLRLGSIPFEMYAHGNFGEKLHLRFGYRRRDGALLQDGPRLRAVPTVTMTIHSAENLDLVLRAEYGYGFGIWGGLRIWAF